MRPPPTDHTPQRTARGNATLLRLDCEQTLQPAAKAHPHLAFLQKSIDLITDLPGPDEPAENNQWPHSLSEAISQALTQATATLPPRQHPAHKAHRQVIQVLARCQNRAQRLQPLSTGHAST